MSMQLANLLHCKIVVLGPRLFDQEKLDTVTLVGLEESGIWIESEEAASRLAGRFHVKPASTVAFFIPFTQITTIIASKEASGVVETT